MNNLIWEDRCLMDDSTHSIQNIKMDECDLLDDNIKHLFFLKECGLEFCATKILVILRRTRTDYTNQLTFAVKYVSSILWLHTKHVLHSKIAKCGKFVCKMRLFCCSKTHNFETITRNNLWMSTSVFARTIWRFESTEFWLVCALFVCFFFFAFQYLSSCWTFIWVIGLREETL